MIFYGSQASRIADLKINGTTCERCQKTSAQHVSVFSKHAHLYWIPLFPIGRVIVSECESCKITIKQKEFSAPLKSQLQLQKDNIKTPIWKWTGTGIIAMLIFAIWSISPSPDKDPRRQLLKNDLMLTSIYPEESSDTTSAKLKTMFTTLATVEFRSDRFEYLTKEDDEKILVLIKMPELHRVVDEERDAIIQIVEMFTSNEEAENVKPVYIGVSNGSRMILVKTPDSYENDDYASQKPLYAYYGNPPAE